MSICILILLLVFLVDNVTTGFSLSPLATRRYISQGARHNHRCQDDSFKRSNNACKALYSTAITPPTGSSQDGDQSTTAEVASPPPPSSVQRVYETFQWKYGDDQFNINYRVEGNGTIPVLLVHGFGGNVNHFRFQYPAFAQEPDYRVYAIDLLGFGASDKPIHVDYGMELLVQLLQDFMGAMEKQQQQQQQQQQLQQWFIVGNSIGGLCTLALANAIPDSIQGVVLLNCAGGLTGFRLSEIPWFIRPLLYFVQTVILGPVFGGYYFEKFKTRDNIQQVLSVVYRNTTNVNDELLDLIIEPSNDENAKDVFLITMAQQPPGPIPEALLPNITCPILALWGTNDPWTPLDGGVHPGSQFYKYVNDLDKYTLIPLEGAGHCPHDECPDLVNGHMISWMNENKK